MLGPPDCLPRPAARIAYPGPAPGQRGGGRRGGRGKDPRLFRGVHHAHRGPGGENPGQAARAQVSPPAPQRGQHEEHQERFLDVVTAVKHHRRRNGRQQRRDDRRRPAQAIGKQQEQADQPQAEDHGHDAIVHFPAAGQIFGPAQGQRREGQPVEAGAVVIGGIVFVRALFKQPPCLDRLVGFVGVHGPLCEPRQAKRGRERQNDQHRSRKQHPGTTHGRAGFSPPPRKYTVAVA